MKKQMSHKKFKLLVLLLDLIYFLSLIFLLFYFEKNNFISKVFEVDSFVYDLIWSIPTIVLLGLNWQMFDEKYAEEKKEGTYEKNNLARKRRNKYIFLYLISFQ